MKVFYYGCWNGAGHFLFDEHGRSMRGLPTDPGVVVPAMFANYPDQLDGGFCPAGGQVEGRALVSYVGGWTVLAFWDRSVDERGNSNSAFVIRGAIAFDGALTVAREKFPTIFGRFTFPIVDAAPRERPSVRLLAIEGAEPLYEHDAMFRDAVDHLRLYEESYQDPTMALARPLVAAAQARAELAARIAAAVGAIESR